MAPLNFLIIILKKKQGVGFRKQQWSLIKNHLRFCCWEKKRAEEHAEELHPLSRDAHGGCTPHGVPNLSILTQLRNEKHQLMTILRPHTAHLSNPKK